MIIQWLIFDPIAIFGLLKTSNGLDLHLGAHMIKKLKKKNIAKNDMIHCSTRPCTVMCLKFTTLTLSGVKTFGTKPHPFSHHLHITYVICANKHGMHNRYAWTPILPCKKNAQRTEIPNSSKLVAYLYHNVSDILFWCEIRTLHCPWRVPIVSMKKELVILLYKTTGGTHQERKSDKFCEEAFNFEDTRF